MINPKIKKWAGYILVAVPFVGYSVYWTLHPSYWFNGDPAAFYFLDSLSVFVGKTYTYVDHPGTPIHIIGSLMLALIRPFFKDANSFVQFFLESPAAFFIMSSYFFTGFKPVHGGSLLPYCIFNIETPSVCRSHSVIVCISYTPSTKFSITDALVA